MSTRASAALKLWTATELRRRWASLVLLGLLAGVSSGIAIAAFEGSQRSETAYQRMRRELQAADAVFFPSQVNLGDIDVAQLGQIEQVVAWGGFSLSNGILDELGEDASPLIAVGDDWFDTIENAKVLEGRLPDPAAPDEAVINLPAADDGFGIGAEFTFRNLSREQGAEFPFGVPADFDWSTADGPITTLRVVGVVRLPIEYVASFANGPAMITGPGWAATHFDDASILFTNGIVRLENGSADIPAVQRRIAELYGRDDLPLKDLSEDIKRVQRSVEIERTALVLFGAAVTVAAIVLVGQGIVRSVAVGASGTPVLRAMGLSRTALHAGLLAPHLVSVAVALVVAAITAIAASALFPIGLARRLDPDLGVHAAFVPLTVGLLAMAAMFVASTMVVVALTTRKLARDRAPRRHVVVGAATRAGIPVPPAVGTSLALEQAPAQRASVRPALLAAVVGVVAVVAASTLVRGIDDALAEPARVGTVWDLEGHATSDEEVAQFEQLAPSDDFDGVSVVWRWTSLVEGVDAPLYAFIGTSGQPVRYVTLKGRAPIGDDEIALGPRTASVIDAGVGDMVAIGAAGQEFRVVGIALLQQTPHSAFDEGVWMSETALDDVNDEPGEFRDLIALMRLRPDADRDDVMAQLNESHWVEVPATAPDVLNLANVRRLPLTLATFLVALAIGAVAHALLTGVRHRARELAVLRALGITPRQAAACVSWQATIIGLIALAVGVPVGVVIGRAVWRLTADSLSFVYVGPSAVAAMLLVIPGALAVCWILSVWPARSAGRRPAAEILRSE